MHTIYKYTIGLKINEITTHRNAKILSVQNQNNEITVWLLVDKSQPLITKRFVVQGTGWNIPKHEADMLYIGTAQIGSFVWHVFSDNQ